MNADLAAVAGLRVSQVAIGADISISRGDQRLEVGSRSAGW